MTDQHRATDEQWAHMEKLALQPGLLISPCLLELRDRIQQLEAGQQVPVISSAADRVLALQDQIRDGALSLADALKEIGAPEADRQHPPVDRVARLIANFASEGLPGDDATPIARSVIREVAEWLRSEYPLREGYGTAWANLLDDHAGQ